MALVFMQLHKTLRRLAHAAGIHEHKTPIMAGAAGQSRLVHTGLRT